MSKPPLSPEQLFATKTVNGVIEYTPVDITGQENIRECANKFLASHPEYDGFAIGNEGVKNVP